MVADKISFHSFRNLVPFAARGRSSEAGAAAVVHVCTPGHPASRQPTPQHGCGAAYQSVHAAEGPLLRLLCRARRSCELKRSGGIRKRGHLQYYVVVFIQCWDNGQRETRA